MIRIMDLDGQSRKTNVELTVPLRPLLKAHQVQVFSSNSALHGELSQQVMETT